MEQFIGILDKNLKQIYEGDIVKFKSLDEELVGEVNFKKDFGAYYVGDYGIYNLDISSFEVVGSLRENYIYNEHGELIKKSNS